MENLKKSRIAGIDIVKSLAVFFVVAVHFFLNTKYYSSPLDNFTMLFQAGVRRIVLTSVPLFVLSTGYLEYKKDTSNGFYRKIFRVIVPYALITVVYILFGAIGGNFDFKSALKSIFDFSGIGYAWYVNMYIGLFLMIPIFNAAIKSLDKKGHFKAIVALAVIICLPQTINPIIDEVTALQFFYTPNWWKSIYPILYYFIGAYLAKYKVQIKKSVCLVGALLIPVADVTLQYFMNKIKLNNWRFVDYGYLPCVFEALFIFMLFCNVDLKDGFIKKTVRKISSLTLYIYLFSKFSDKLVYAIVYTYIIDKNAENAQERLFAYGYLPTVLSSFIIALLCALMFNFFYKKLKRLTKFIMNKTGLSEKIGNIERKITEKTSKTEEVQEEVQEESLLQSQ